MTTKQEEKQEQEVVHFDLFPYHQAIRRKPKNEFIKNCHKCSFKDKCPDELKNSE